MAIKKGICIAGLVCVISAQLGVSQTPQYAQLPRTLDPFSLSQGSSFSASGARPVAGASASRREAISSDLKEALDLIAKNHVGGKQINSETLAGSAITSMLHALDPHSNYHDPRAFQELLGEHESEYMGTGSSIASFERAGQIDTYVVSTFAGSPAAKAGLRFGDRILAVNGRQVSGESPDTVRDLVRGPRGTSVRITVERADTRKPETLEMKRDRVHEPAVPKGFLLKGNVGYLDLTNGFSNATFGEFESALNDLKGRGMASLVLDLRGNGGGILEQAVRIAEKFLPAGSTIVSQRGRYADDTRTWKAAKIQYESMPLILLVDENTASASEVLAGAIQDNDRALIVGRKTYGKGLVQSVLDLPQGAGLTLTAARYYTPTGRSIQREYAESGLYNYYNHRTTVGIDTPAYAARTITSRVVYGGDGITPDEIAAADDLTPQRLRLLDPIFLFCREAIGGRLSAPGKSTSDQRAVPGGPLRAGQLLKEFEEFVGQDGEWADLQAAVARESAFVSRMLNYYLSLGISGTEAANRARVEADRQVRQAIEALPRSAQLAAAAQKARTAPRKEKSSLSLVLSEQR